jgi:hypothetical protein
MGEKLALTLGAVGTNGVIGARKANRLPRPSGKSACRRADVRTLDTMLDNIGIDLPA